MKADIQKILLNGEDRPDLYSVHKLVDIAPEVKPKIVAEFHGKPINYHTNGSFEACILDLIPEQNWEFEYVNRANNFVSYFNDRTDPENPTLASFEIINSQGVARWINYKMCGVAGASQGIPEGNKITYADVFPGIDLRYIVDTWRLKEDIIIKQPVSSYGYKFTLKLDANVSLVQQEDGSIDFVDLVTSERLWGIAKPFAKDAIGNETWGVRYILGKELYNGIEYDSIEVVIEDTEFLQNALFPILIDPTTNYSVTNAESLAVWGTGASYPPAYTGGSATDSTIMATREFSGGTYRIVNGCFRWDTSVLPEDAVVSASKFKMTTPYAPTNVDVRNFCGEWYNHGGMYDISDYTTGAATTAFNVAISSVVSGSNSITLSNLGNVSKTGFTGIRTSISGAIPTGSNEVTINNISGVLEVTYSQPPGTPTVTAPNGGESYNASATITWTAATDPEGDALTYDIDYSPDNGTNWYDIASGVSGTSYVWNTSALTAGSLYLVRIRAYDGVAYGAFDQSNGVFTIQHSFSKKIIGVQTPAKVMGSVAMKVLGNS